MSLKRKRDFNSSLSTVGDEKSVKVRSIDKGRNVTKYVESTFMWKIREVHQQLECYKSPVFTSFFTNHKKIRWMVNLHRRYCKDYYELTMESIYLMDFLYTKVIKIKAYIINKNNMECNFHETEIQVTEAFAFRVAKFVSLEDLSNENKGLLKNKSLTIVIQLNFGKDLFSQDFSIYDSSICHRLKEFDNFEKLLESDKFSDVKLIVESKEICAHKCILSARSRVFSAMFEHNMKERQENVVEIDDIKYDVMKEILRYIYAGKVNNINDLAKDLLAAADKYEIDGLKSICEKVLINTTNIENIGAMLLLVDRYNVDSLKSHAFNFLSDNAKDIVNTPNFDLVIKKLSPTMLPEVLLFVLKFKQ